MKARDSKAKEGLLGFVGYKVGMISILASDLTPNSLTQNQQIVLPVTVVETPPMKLYSIRFFNNSSDNGYGKNKSMTEIPVIDSRARDSRDLKRRVRVAKQIDVEKKLNAINLNQVEDIRVVLYTQPRLAAIKKKPDIVEVGINASAKEKKLELAKSLIGKEINFSDIFQQLDTIDVKGVTKGKGFQGVIKRLGVGLRRHKSEKGVRKVGSISSWTPKKLDYRAPLAGQLGFSTREQYNNLILQIGSKQDASKFVPAGGFQNYGILRNPFVLVKGSLQGAQKRPLLITFPLRVKKKHEKYEVVRAG